MNKSEEKVLAQAWEKYGAANQLDMLVEECAELIQAVNKLKRKAIPLTNPLSAQRVNLAEEIADVEIMLHQVKVGLNLTTEVEEWTGSKMWRLSERLAK